MGTDLLKIAERVAAGHAGRPRTAGKIEFVKDTGPVRRDIRVDGFEWSADALRDLAKILWAAQRSHSYALAALRLFSKIPSSKFSPDGMLGGRGYIQAVKDMRTGLGQVVEHLSSFTDTVHDEINANHWSAESGEEEVSDIVEGAEDVKENPEAFVEREFREESGDGDGFVEPVSNPDPDDYNPSVEQPDEPSEDDGEDESGQVQTASYDDVAIVEEHARRREKRDVETGAGPGEPGSQLPIGTGEQGQGKTAPEMVMNTTTPAHGNYAASIRRIVDAFASRKASARTADSSVPVETLPGPRVDHIGPAAGNEAGHFNDDAVWPSDDLGGEGLSSGTNVSKPLEEDWTADGVTGYDNPTDGDSSVLAIASSVTGNTYSWLPGSANEKNLDYYARGLTDKDVEWLHEHAQPDMSAGILPKKVQPDTSGLWEVNF